MAVDFLAKVEVLREELDLFRQVSRSIDDRDIFKAAVIRLRRALTQVEAFAGGAGPQGDGAASDQRGAWLLLSSLVAVTRRELRKCESHYEVTVSSG
jgi:hypothetical protein